MRNWLLSHRKWILLCVLLSGALLWGSSLVLAQNGEEEKERYTAQDQVDEMFGVVVEKVLYPVLFYSFGERTTEVLDFTTADARSGWSAPEASEADLFHAPTEAMAAPEGVTEVVTVGNIPGVIAHDGQEALSPVFHLPIGANYVWLAGQGSIEEAYLALVDPESGEELKRIAPPKSDTLTRLPVEILEYADQEMQWKLVHTGGEAYISFGGAVTVKEGIPLIIIVLVGGGIFYTFRYGFVNLRLFPHAFAVVRGKYDDPNDKGEISHFQALTSALAATVGLGNIAGVALAITAGGPGAIFWMWLTAFFGMSMKFSSCTLAVVYRIFREDSHVKGGPHVIGGPMVYLRLGMKDRWPRLAWIGAILSPMFAIITIMAAFGGGNMFQTNQTYSVIAEIFQLQDEPILQPAVGLVMMALVGLVIIGGIKRIGEVTSKLVPAMCVGYVIVCLIIVGNHIDKVPALLFAIVDQAFSSEAMYGGFLGVMLQGMRRAAFSNEAGLGSAAIAHAAVKTNEPIREGLVAMLGPFIDTILVCTMTALAILITDAHLTTEDMRGISITAQAFGSVHAFFPYFLAIAVFIFAYSTLISWSYYGERAVEYLFGRYGGTAVGAYRALYLLIAFVGPSLALNSVVDFADMMLLSMAFPNILGMLLLSGKVRELKNDYIRRLKSGEMKPQP